LHSRRTGQCPATRCHDAQPPAHGSALVIVPCSRFAAPEIQLNWTVSRAARTVRNSVWNREYVERKHGPEPDSRDADGSDPKSA